MEQSLCRQPVTVGAGFRHMAPRWVTRWATRWDGLWAGCVLTLVLGIQGCASSTANSPNMPAGCGWTPLEINSLSSFGQAYCDSDQDVLPPMDELKPEDLAKEITRYLNEHCLPLVRASATRVANGDPAIMLYGFVPSASARQQAEATTDQLIAFTAIPLKDAIMVRPELASATANPTPNTGNPADDSDGAAQQMVIEQDQNQDHQGSLTIPLVSALMGPGITANTIGGGMPAAPGAGLYPLGYAAPNPYYPIGLGAGFGAGGFRSDP
jgi:hypothetical protein